jgi:hypothetical protein
MLSPASQGVAETIGFRGTERDEEFGYLFAGYLRAPRDAVYTFTLVSDDGSRLLIGEDLVIDNDGFHGPTARYAMIALEAGYHPISIRFFQAGGEKALGLAVQADDGGGPQPFVDWLFHEQQLASAPSP